MFWCITYISPVHGVEFQFVYDFCESTVRVIGKKKIHGLVYLACPAQVQTFKSLSPRC